MKKTKDAWNVLLPIAEKFPENPIIPYNLACYACQLGNLKEAGQWLAKAIHLDAKKDIRMRALDNLDLEPPWVNISENLKGNPT